MKGHDQSIYLPVSVFLFYLLFSHKNYTVDVVDCRRWSCFLIFCHLSEKDWLSLANPDDDFQPNLDIGSMLEGVLRCLLILLKGF